MSIGCKVTTAVIRIGQPSGIANNILLLSLDLYAVLSHTQSLVNDTHTVNCYKHMFELFNLAIIIRALAWKSVCVSQGVFVHDSTCRLHGIIGMCARMT